MANNLGGRDCANCPEAVVVNPSPELRVPAERVMDLRIFSSKSFVWLDQGQNSGGPVILDLYYAGNSTLLDTQAIGGLKGDGAVFARLPFFLLSWLDGFEPRVPSGEVGMYTQTCIFGYS